MPVVWGHLADRRGEATRVLTWVLIGAALPLVMLPFTHHLGALFTALAVASLFRAGAAPLLDSATLTVTAAVGSHYGTVRQWGSAGFIVGALGVGLLADAFGPPAIAWSSFLLALLASFIAMSLPAAPRQASHAGFRHDVRELFALAPYRRLLAVTFVNRLSMATAVTFVPAHFKEVGGWEYLDVAMYWAIGAAAEIVVFRVAPRFGHPRGLATLYLVGTAALLVRYGGLLACHDKRWVLGLQITHGLTFGAWYYASVNYAGKLVPERLRASGQALFGAIGFGLAVGGSSLFLGKIYDLNGLDALAAFSLAAGTVALVASLRVARDIRVLPQS